MKIIVMTTIIIVTIVIIVLTIIIINYDACWNKYQITIYLYIYYHTDGNQTTYQ